MTFELTAADAQTQRLDLPTERDILAGMDIAGSLVKGHRPQANLVPDQQDSVIAVGTLLPGDDAGPVPKARPGNHEAVGQIDLRQYLMSPIENTLLGPVAPQESWLPPDLVRHDRDAIDAAFLLGEAEATVALGPPPGWQEVLVVAAGVTLSVASRIPKVSRDRQQVRKVTETDQRGNYFLDWV